MGIADDDVARVRGATDIVALIGEHVGLKRVGRRYSGLCPFHAEKTPSFSVNPELGVYHCFGCGRSGDAITFVRDVEGLDFVGAVERLATRAGIELRYDDVAVSKERARKQRLAECVAAAIDFYHELLLRAPEGGGARRYLRGRGFDGDAARRFSLGYAPDGWDRLSRHLQNARFSRDDVVDAGLAFVNRSNRLTDHFRNRVVFPIYDARDTPVGFGGRTLGDDPRKYVNSPEGPLYHKSRLLYGLSWARAEIVARGEVVVCEGYTDVMAFVLAGLPNAVATCGTALTDDHVQVLKNLARRVTLAYDADAAGQAAAERWYGWEQRYEIEVRVADLPAGRDPADAWYDDPASLVRAVERAAPFLEFRLDRLLGAADVGTVEGRARAAERAARLIAEHPSDLVRDQYLMKVADRVGIDADRLRAAAAQRAGAGSASTDRRPRDEGPAGEPPGGPPSPPVAWIDRRELDALRWAVHAPTLVGDRIDRELFGDPLATAAFDALASADTFRDALDRAAPPVAALLEQLAVEEVPDNEPAEVLVTRMVVNLVESSSQRLLRSMLKSGDERSATVKSLLDTLVREREAGEWSAAEKLGRQLVGWVVAESDVGGHDGHG